MSVHVRACVFIKCVCVCLCSYKPNFHGWSHMLLPGNAACCRECFPPSFFFFVCVCVCMWPHCEQHHKHQLIIIVMFFFFFK